MYHASCIIHIFSGLSVRSYVCTQEGTANSREMLCIFLCTNKTKRQPVTRVARCRGGPNQREHQQVGQTASSTRPEITGGTQVPKRCSSSLLVYTGTSAGGRRSCSTRDVRILHEICRMRRFSHPPDDDSLARRRKQAGVLGSDLYL